MIKPTAYASQQAGKSVALQYVQQQVANDMAALYKAFRPQSTSQKTTTSPSKSAQKAK